MLRTRILLVIVCAAVIALLYFLPKVVVENDGQLKSAADSVAHTEALAAQGHSELPMELKQSIKVLRTQYLAGLSNQKNAIFADSLRSLYAQAGQFDSAAWYGEQAATFFKTNESFQKQAMPTMKRIRLPCSPRSKRPWQRKHASGWAKQ